MDELPAHKSGVPLFTSYGTPLVFSEGSSSCCCCPPGCEPTISMDALIDPADCSISTTGSGTRGPCDDSEDTQVVTCTFGYSCFCGDCPNIDLDFNCLVDDDGNNETDDNAAVERICRFIQTSSTNTTDEDDDGFKDDTRMNEQVLGGGVCSDGTLRELQYECCVTNSLGCETCVTTHFEDINIDDCCICATAEIEVAVTPLPIPDPEDLNDLEDACDGTFEFGIPRVELKITVSLTLPPDLDPSSDCSGPYFVDLVPNGGFWDICELRQIGTAPLVEYTTVVQYTPESPTSIIIRVHNDKSCVAAEKTLLIE